MSDQDFQYKAYLLRLWRGGPGVAETQWRASLENSRTGERLGFGNLEQLFYYLQDLTEAEIRESENHVQPTHRQ